VARAAQRLTPPPPPPCRQFLSLLVLVAVARAAPRPEKLDLLERNVQLSAQRERDRFAQILSQQNQHQDDGGYQQQFSTDNGIQHQERGTSYPGIEPETGSFVKEGTYEYLNDDGSIVTISYVADENGFEVLNKDALVQLLPTPPPTQYPPPQVPGSGLPVPEPLPQFNQ